MFRIFRTLRRSALAWRGPATLNSIPLIETG
jgi:hypothetical protein